MEIKAPDRAENREKEKEVKIEGLELKEAREVEHDDGGAAERGKSSGGGSDVSGGSRSDASAPESQNIGWGRWYSLGELEMATRGFAEENVIGEGGYGIVYRGVLQDGSVVAVKNLLNNKYVNLTVYTVSHTPPLSLSVFFFFSRKFSIDTFSFPTNRGLMGDKPMFVSPILFAIQVITVRLKLVFDSLTVVFC